MVAYSWPFFFIFVTQPIFEAWIDTIALIDVDFCFSLFLNLCYLYIFIILLYLLYI